MMNVFFLDEKCDEKKSIEIGLSSIKSGYLNIVFQKENRFFCVVAGPFVLIYEESLLPKTFRLKVLRTKKTTQARCELLCTV